ncbi:MAG: bifunctional glutamate N-acetyltransferase/amino-acid acetyltransferase ArgJ [Actinomycetota bacterium]
MTVSAVSGFSCSGLACGIKTGGGLDLALVLAAGGASAAGVFTKNSAAAAPVLLSRRRLGGGRLRAVILNSGCANAGTGAAGQAAVETVTAAAARLLSAPASEVVMCSTGPIGEQLPVEPIVSALPRLVASASASGGDDAARAILTTDTRPKTVLVDRGGFRLGGMAKGAGMLRPDLATMLCVLTTDAPLPASSLAEALAGAVATTFNSMNVDGCESTNDTVLLLSSGTASPPPAGSFDEALTEACRNLALQMAADAEGASRTVIIRVAGADDVAMARTVGRAIADSVLVRSSFYGGDPNWGRVLAAIGTCGIDPAGISIAYDGVMVAEAGAGVPFAGSLTERLRGDFTIDVRLGRGPGEAEIITTDLTPDYVRFNGGRS